MPLYEYKCKKCGHRFELIQSFSAEDPKECPVCHGEVERLISTPARAHFKGSGFYSTDYGSKSSGSGSSESSAPAKTESTAAAAPAASTSTTKSE
jgi:putative FmdB family regulatory protein